MKHTTNKADVLLGLQWGDEGKGKVIDVLTPEYDVIARFQGGPNAGHTLEFEGKKHVLHLIPSGIFHPGKINFLGNGMVLCSIAFKEECESLLKFMSLEELKKRIVISDGAKIILPVHRLLDKASEAAKGKDKIGSTLKGISPAYTDHISRNGIKVRDILHDDFGSKCEKIQNKHCERVTAMGYPWTAAELIEENHQFYNAVRFMKEFQIVNGPYWINKQLDAGKKILAEGAQGTLLDIDHGNYPFVTSSNTISAGVCTGLGIAPNRIGEVIGLFKAYCTRVGSGPFPTELGGKKAEVWAAETKREEEKMSYPNPDINDGDTFTQGIAIRAKGAEFGATTGRLRRCGWLDLPALKYAVMINGVTQFAISKADVLSGINTVNVCTGYYTNEGQYTDELSEAISSASTKVYDTFAGWDDLTEAENVTDLPNNFKKYLKFIEEETEVPITIISTGPDRNQVLRDIK